MNINRATVKQQAKDIIKGNVLKLFIISLIIGALTGGGTAFSSGSNIDLDDIFDGKNPFSDRGSKNDDDFYNFDEFTTDYDSDFFDGFDGNGKVTLHKLGVGGLAMAGIGIFAALLGLIAMAASLALAPLKIMLDGLYWQLIRGNNMDFGDGLGFIFKKTFDKNYWAKFLLNLVQGILLALLYVAFIIPGVIFTYKWYFTSYILAERPELSYDQAMEISKKMTNGHKGELFVLDLSFIPWYLLMIPTLGIISIYVTPYVSTTKALYYENFKIRAMQEGAITEYDFLTKQEKLGAAYPQGAQYNNQNYAAPQQAYYPTATSPMQETYYTPAQPVQPEPQQNYYQPAQPVQPEPQQNYYQPAQPVQPESQQNYYQPAQPVQPEPQQNYYQPAQPVQPESEQSYYQPTQPEVPQQTEYYYPETPEQNGDDM